MVKGKIAITLLAAFMSIIGFAQNKGLPLFQDSFSTKDTFAENWTSGSRNLQFNAGNVTMPTGGDITMNRKLPLEFCAEATLVINKGKNPISFESGFTVSGYRFFMRGDGLARCVFKLPDAKKSQGKSRRYAGFELGKPFKITMIRKVKSGSANYILRINGKSISDFYTDAPVEDANGSYGKLTIFSRSSAIVSNFGLFTLKKSDNDSNNVIFNSGFEYTQDGFPLNYGRSSFDMRQANKIPYEDFINTWTLDTKEKHSGKQSLRVVLDNSVKYHDVWAVGAATFEGKSGVFSVWMKSDKENFPVGLRYGRGFKEVLVGKTWKRYETAIPSLPAPNPMSPVLIRFQKVKGTLWIDDLQAEIINKIDEKDAKSGKTFATPYKPAAFDDVFIKGNKIKVKRAPAFTIPKLAKNVKPGLNIDTWIGQAVKLDKFYVKGKPAKEKIEAYIACDNENLYLAYRCYTSDFSKMKSNLNPFYRGVEFFFDPAADGTYYQFAVNSAGKKITFGKNHDRTWNCLWESEAKINKQKQSIDYFISLPLGNFADAAMKKRWLVNICRNDQPKNYTITQTPDLYKKTEYWAYAALPGEVIEKYTLGVKEGTCSGKAITLELGNRTGKEREVKVEIINAQKNRESLYTQKITLNKGKNVISFVSPVKTRKINVKLFENGKLFGNQLVTLVNSAPLSLLGRLSFYMNEPEAVFKVSASLPDVDKLIAVLSVAGKTVKKPASSNFKIAIPLNKIANGTYPVTLNLKKDGKTVATASSKLIKRPYKAGATQINHFTRSLIHDGKPIIPMMPFTSAPLRDSDAIESAHGYVDWLVKYGFKYVHFLVDGSTVKSGAAFLKYANEKGIKVLLWTKYISIPDAQGKRSIIRPNGDPNWDKFQKSLDFPCVISQMVTDEPELSLKSEVTKAFMDQMRPRFPYHPTHMNNTVIGIPAGYADLNTDIIGIDDYLTNRPDRTVESVLVNVDIAVEAGKPEGKPSISFIACHTPPVHPREPTYAEQIAQSYGCIAAGSNGITFYIGDPTTTGNWKALQQLNKEILSLTDVLVSEEECEPATASDPKLRIRTQKYQGYLYVISCNTINNQMKQVNLFLPANLQYDGDVEVLFENRKIPMNNNAFTDDFKGYSRHVYKIKIK